MREKIDGRGVGGFYESIMALMIVTVGVGLLTVSFTIISSDRPDEVDRSKCDRVMQRLLNDPSVVLSDRLLDVSSMAHLDLDGELEGITGIKVMLTYPDGHIEVCFQKGEWDGLERWSRSEAVNVLYHRADVRSAMLVVWMWQ